MFFPFLHFRYYFCYETPYLEFQVDSANIHFDFQGCTICIYRALLLQGMCLVICVHLKESFFVGIIIKILYFLFFLVMLIYNTGNPVDATLNAKYLWENASIEETIIGAFYLFILSSGLCSAEIIRQLTRKKVAVIEGNIRLSPLIPSQLTSA